MHKQKKAHKGACFMSADNQCIPIIQYNEYIELQSRYPRTVGNDCMLPSEIRKCLEHGKLSAIADERALLILEQREGFRKLHFRLIDENANLPPHDGMLAAYLTYHKERYPGKATDWLRGQGFTYKKTLIRHTAREITGILSNEGVENASADEVYSMFRECFDVVEADLPPRDMFAPENSYCIRSAEGEPLGILYDMGRTLVIAVSQRARGQGIGRRLYRAYASGKAGMNTNHVFHEWISPDNAASLAMFRSLGFAPDATMSDCFVKECVYEKNHRDTAGDTSRC